MTMDEITWLPVTTILRETWCSCDFGAVSDYDDDTHFWQHLISNKAADSGFGHLVDSILEHGFAESSAVGWYDGEITEGHHRLVAAILLGMDEVPTSPYGGSWYPNGRRLSAHYNDDHHAIDIDV